MSENARGIASRLRPNTTNESSKYPSTMIGTTISETNAKRRIPPNRITAITSVIAAPLQATGMPNADSIEVVTT